MDVICRMLPAPSSQTAAANPMPNDQPLLLTFAETILDINNLSFATQNFPVRLTISAVWPHLR
jgi:hypothetical protein